MTLYCNVQNGYLLLFARRNEKEEKEKLLNHINEHSVLFYSLLKIMVMWLMAWHIIRLTDTLQVAVILKIKKCRQSTLEKAKK